MSTLAIYGDPGAGFNQLASPPEIIWGHQKYFAYNFWLRRDADMGMVPLCLSQQDASIDIQYDLFWSTWVNTWPWPEDKF